MSGIVVVAALVAAAGAAAAHEMRTASCEEAKRINGWCTTDDVGFVASVPIHSKFLYEVLDPHGHEIIKAQVTCATCRKAIETDGFCPDHKMGYVGGAAYMSPITWHLARARKLDPATIECPVCRDHMKSIGWCEKDARGIAGYFAVDDRKEFEALQAAYAILLRANDMSKRCERCAGAMITDGYCAIHRVRYDGGKAVSGTPP
jgi:hypothetical protein